MNIPLITAFIFGIMALTGCAFFVIGIITNLKNRSTIPGDRSTDIINKAFPILIPITGIFALLANSSAQDADALKSIKPTPNNINVSTYTAEIVPLHTAYPKVNVGNPTTTYLASGNRNAVNDSHIDLMVGFDSIAAQQFVIKSTTGKLKTVEISGNAVKIIKDLNPTGHTTPYYTITTCTWKNSAVTKACPTQKLEVHLYTNTTTYRQLMTQDPSNLNDMVNDPAVATQTRALTKN